LGRKDGDWEQETLAIDKDIPTDEEGRRNSHLLRAFHV